MLRIVTLALSGLLLHEAVRNGVVEWAPAPGLPVPLPPVEEPTPVPQETVVEAVPVVPELPSAAELSAVAPGQVAAIKKALYGQTLRLLQEEHRLTPENLRESADAAEQSGAPQFWVQAMRALACEALAPRERHDLEGKVRQFYALCGMDALSVRLFIETSNLSPMELETAATWLPWEHVFNLPPAEQASPEELRAQALAIKSVFATLKVQLSAARDRESADAAAAVLLPTLAPFDSAQRIRLASPQEQVKAFSPDGEFLQSAYRSIQEQRKRLMEADYYGSARLRAVDYLMQ